MDIITIGDTTVDEFIRLKDANVTCDISSEHCTISMKWGDKIPYDFAELIPAVGNAANAAVAAARLGLAAGFISNVGADAYGTQILDTFRKEGVSTNYIREHQNVKTNHHYVLWYESERTILIRHEAFPYAFPSELEPPKWFYLSSMGNQSEALHVDVMRWLKQHPETKLAFQPGTFQISMGKEKLAELYRETELLACNKDEAERILGLPETEVSALLDALHELGPKIVLITDGPKGAYAFDGTKKFKVPMYPDPKPPFERTGAGDACTSTIVAALCLGKPIEEALLWGPINAMAVVQDIGAQRGLLDRAVLEKYLAEAPLDYRVTPL
jgi:ribokinase